MKNLIDILNLLGVALQYDERTDRRTDGQNGLLATAPLKVSPHLDAFGALRERWRKHHSALRRAVYYAN